MITAYDFTDLKNILTVASEMIFELIAKVCILEERFECSNRCVEHESKRKDLKVLNKDVVVKRIQRIYFV